MISYCDEYRVFFVFSHERTNTLQERSSWEIRSFRMLNWTFSKISSLMLWNKFSEFRNVGLDIKNRCARISRSVYVLIYAADINFILNDPWQREQNDILVPGHHYSDSCPLSTKCVFCSCLGQNINNTKSDETSKMKILHDENSNVYDFDVFSVNLVGSNGNPH